MCVCASRYRLNHLGPAHHTHEGTALTSTHNQTDRADAGWRRQTEYGLGFNWHDGRPLLLRLLAVSSRLSPFTAAKQRAGAIRKQ